MVVFRFVLIVLIGSIGVLKSEIVDLVLVSFAFQDLRFLGAN